MIISNSFRPLTRLFRFTPNKLLVLLLALWVGIIMSACSPMNVPETRTVDIPPAAKATPRQEALNETRDSIQTIPLEEDILVPQLKASESLPLDKVGPLELRAETLAGALQLVLAGYNIPIAFQTDEGLTRKVTVANLTGTVDHVVRRLCGLADLYCTYNEGILEVKERETFTVSLPPLDEAAYTSIAGGLKAVSGAEVTVDSSTRTMIYSLSQRNADRAERYFDRLRSNTALIVYETYIWEVQLGSSNNTGINWQQLEEVGAYNTGIDITTVADNQVSTPITIGLPTKGSVNFDSGDILRFISDQGAVKTISQPQITVLSGSSANLKVAETINYIESLTRTTDDNGDETVSTTTAEVNTGFTLDIASSWDESTVYATIKLEIDEFLGFQDFEAGSDDTLELPRTSERELTTQIRSRPGDSILIAGLVRERDEYDSAGAGFSQPLVPVSRTGRTDNIELVILLRPRVIRYVAQEELALAKENDQHLKVKKGEVFKLVPEESAEKPEDFDMDLLLNPSVTIEGTKEKEGV